MHPPSCFGLFGGFGYQDFGMALLRGRKAKGAFGMRSGARVHILCRNVCWILSQVVDVKHGSRKLQMERCVASSSYEYYVEVFSES